MAKRGFVYGRGAQDENRLSRVKMNGSAALDSHFSSLAKQSLVTREEVAFNNNYDNNNDNKYFTPAN